jgi:hypothetical protein
MAARWGFQQVMRDVQERGDALDLVKYHSSVFALGGFDLAQERRRLGEVLLMGGRMQQVQKKDILVLENLAQERTLAGQPGAE